MRRIITTNDLTDEEWNEDKNLSDDDMFSQKHNDLLDRNDQRQAEARVEVLRQIGDAWKVIKVPVRQYGKHAIVHRAVREDGKGRLQISYFDDKGPVGHVFADNLAKALEKLHDEGANLREVIAMEDPKINESVAYALGGMGIII